MKLIALRRQRPHLRRVRVLGNDTAWLCTGNGRFSFGRTPNDAYTRWLIRLVDALL